MNTTTTAQPFTRPFSFGGQEYTATEYAWQELKSRPFSPLTFQGHLSELLESGEVTDETA